MGFYVCPGFPFRDARPYLSRVGDKLTVIPNLPTTTPKQVGNTCVTASMVYLANIFGKTINRTTYDNIINNEKGIDIVKQSLNSEDAKKFIMNNFNTKEFTSTSDAFNAGSVICASIVINETATSLTCHNVIIVGTHSNGEIIYMDTNRGYLMEDNLNGIKLRYIFEVTGIE